MTTATCKSGRPLRATFDGLLYLLGDTFRIIDLKAREDRIVSGADLEKSFGKDKWERISTILMMDGFHESGRYRIECWEDKS